MLGTELQHNIDKNSEILLNQTQSFYLIHLWAKHDNQWTK